MKKQLIRFSPFILAAVVVIILQLAVDEGQNLGLYYDVEEELDAMTQRVNQRLPLIIDQYTRLDSTVALPNKTLLLQHTLLNFDFQATDLALLKSEMKQRLINQAKTKPEMRPIVNYQVVMISAYNDESGSELFRVTITPQDYIDISE
jgi:hypothetical protein